MFASNFPLSTKKGTQVYL